MNSNKLMFRGWQTKLLNLQLRDLGESVIDVTLWEKWAEELYSYVKCHKDGPIILVGSLMKTKPYNGKIYVQNSFFSTKLFINSPMAEITKFKECLVKHDHLALSTVSTIACSSSSKHSKASFSLADQKTIAQVPQIHSGASISAIDTTVDWFYIGCTRFFKKVSPYFNPETEEIEAGKYSCDKCDIDVTTTSTRYKLQVKVIYHTGSTSFLLFDRDVIKLINKSAYELLEQQVQFNHSGQIPQELLDLEGQQFVFKIHDLDIAKSNRSSAFRVYELTDEPEIITKFQENILHLNTTDQSIVVVSSLSNSNMSEHAPDSDINTVSTPSNATTNQIDSMSSEAAYYECSITSNNSSSVTKPTPNKKRLLSSPEDNAAQQSSTKPKVLTKAVIKKEKA